MNANILDKVRKLFALAENAGATDAEKENAYEKARALMLSHSLEMWQLEHARDSGKHKPPICYPVLVPQPFANEKRRLLNEIALASRCRVVGLDIEREGKRVEMFGYEDDVAYVEALFANTLIHGFIHELSVPAGTAKQKRDWQAAFWLGYADEIGRRL